MNEIRSRGAPTPDEIRAECERIRETWFEAEYYRRSGRAVPRYFMGRGENTSATVAEWQPPTASVACLVDS